MVNFVTSLIQLNSQDNIKANIEAAENYVQESAAGGAQLICLPENTFFMQEQGKGQQPDQTEGINHCRRLAEELKVWILIGSVQVPIADLPGKSYNRSLLIDADGNITSQYDKIHLFDVTLKNGEAYNESARIAAGRQAVLASTPWGKLGMSVCYDLRFPHLYRTLAHNGADLLSIPAAFTYTTGSAHWHTLLRARAIENFCYVLAPAQCGLHPGNRRTYGHSLVVAPWGEIIAEASEDKPGVTFATINTDKISEARSMVPSLQHDREFSLHA